MSPSPRVYARPVPPRARFSRGGHPTVGDDPAPPGYVAMLPFPTSPGPPLAGVPIWR